MSLQQFAETHEVFNQVPSLDGANLYRIDLPLQEWICRYDGGWAEDRLNTYGALAGGPLMQAGFLANEHKPEFKSHDRYGNRIDMVEFHPAYHAVMRAAIEHGVAGLSWAEPVPGAHVARAALSYLHYQVEPGSSCPLTMTHAAVPVLARESALSEWTRKVSSCRYDSRDVPMADKAGVTLGMGMTEKQGGSDVRANASVATPLAGGDDYLLRGHKWFLSAPMSDGFLVLAQAPGGLTCFLMPRRLADGALNGFRLMRLKDKLGDWSNASSEIEFDAALAHRVGGEGRGVATIIEMVMLTRLDCMLGSAGLMRMALSQALHHCRHRHAFGKALVEQPLMRSVLADLAIEAEAATALAFRVARAVDAAPRDPAEAAFARIATAIGKFWICKRAPAFVNEAQECLGGAGYVEESLLPRLYRQAPLNSIWEGSGNIQCLDVLRALSREPETGAALLAELDGAAGLDGDYDAALAGLRAALSEAPSQAGARLLAERVALLLQASSLLRANSPLSTAFCRNRLGDARGLVFGTLPGTTDGAAMLARAWPDLAP